MQVLNKISKRASEARKAGKSLENADLARAVLRSQPPHADDVPDMVDYNQKWGGGDSEYFVKDIGRFCKAMNISPSVRISGRTFKAFAALNFGIEMASYAVTAVLKRIAASEKVIDGVASSIASSQIVLFNGKHKKNVSGG